MPCLTPGGGGRNYARASEASLPPVLAECVRLLRSEAVFLIFSNLTGLALHELAARHEEEEEDGDEEEDGGEEEEEGEEGERATGSQAKSRPEMKRQRLSSDAGDMKGTWGEGEGEGEEEEEEGKGRRGRGGHEGYVGWEVVLHSLPRSPSCPPLCNTIKVVQYYDVDGSTLEMLLLGRYCH